MKVKEIIEYLNDFNLDSEFCVISPKGMKIVVNKDSFCWDNEGGGDFINYDVKQSKQVAKSVSICLEQLLFNTNER